MTLDRIKIKADQIVGKGRRKIAVPGRKRDVKTSARGMPLLLDFLAQSARGERGDLQGVWGGPY